MPTPIRVDVTALYLGGRVKLSKFHGTDAKANAFPMLYVYLYCAYLFYALSHNVFRFFMGCYTFRSGLTPLRFFTNIQIYM